MVSEILKCFTLINDVICIKLFDNKSNVIGEICHCEPQRSEAISLPHEVRLPRRADALLAMTDQSINYSSYRSLALSTKTTQQLIILSIIRIVIEMLQDS